jgi:EmrB/QacA subfamily drug resistance transporter
LPKESNSQKVHIALERPIVKNNLGRYVALTAILMSSFVSVLNTSMIRVASPILMQDFGASYSDLTWVTNSYQIVYAILLPVFGLLGDRYGKKKCLVGGLVLFALGSLLCGLSWNFWSLIVFRVIQAIGAAAIFPSGVVSATELFPPERRGMVMGIWGTAIQLGNVSGPTIGGLIINWAGWKATFFVNTPIALLSAFGIAMIVKSDATKPEPASFDYIGAVSLGAIVISVVTILQMGYDVGWTSPIVLGMATLLVVSVPVFVRTETRVKQPVIDFNMFRNPVFIAALFTGGSHLIAIQGTQFLMPLFLSQIRNFDSLGVGLVMMPLAAIRVVISPISGIISDKFGNQVPVGLGLILRTAALAMCAFMTSEAPVALITTLLTIDGAGAALIWSPVMNAMLESVPSDQAGSATGVFNMVRFIFGVVGTTVIGVAMDSLFQGTSSAGAPVPGFFQSYLGLAVVTGIGFFAVRSLRSKPKDTTQTHTAARS